MRKAVSLISALILLGLIYSIIRSTPDPSPTSTTPQAISTTTQDSNTDSSRPLATDITSPPSQPAETLATAPASTDAGLQAEFVLTEVAFGTNGYVAITNVGGATGNLEGHALCQRPAYFVLPSIEVEPFQVVWVALGDGSGITNSSIVALVPANGQLGRVESGEGEMALYRSAQFTASEELRSYVEWGSSGHGRASLAIEAGLWEPNSFIEIPDDTFGVSSVAAEPDSPDDWVATIGG